VGRDHIEGLPPRSAELTTTADRAVDRRRLIASCRRSITALRNPDRIDRLVGSGAMAAFASNFHLQLAMLLAA